MDVKEILKKLELSDRRALAKAITLVESTRQNDRKRADQILKEALPKSGKSLRIGISGIPGVGKSSFIEVLGLELIKRGHKVAVLAVDPSSPLSGGSILGDKTRMEELSQNSDAFIRPSPTTGSLGGVANKTRESIFLCEAAGYDIILIETVGVGQSEYKVASMVDLFMVLMVPNAGDEIQGIKKGIIELADLLIINKADGDTKVLAENARTHYQNALNIIKKERFWTPKVLTCSAQDIHGFDKIISHVIEFQEKSQQEGHFKSNRLQQTKAWLKGLFEHELQYSIENNEKIKEAFMEIETRVLEQKLTAREGSLEMLNALRENIS